MTSPSFELALRGASAQRRSWFAHLPRALRLVPFIVAGGALLASFLLASPRPRARPAIPIASLMLFAGLGGVIGITAFLRRFSVPRDRQLGAAALARLPATSLRAISDFNNKTRGRLTSLELAELWIFYERWLNLDSELRSTYREELAMAGIDMIRLGDALRFHRG